MALNEKSKSYPPMTPEEFADGMRGIIQKHIKPDPYSKISNDMVLDREACHYDMDHLMGDLLIRLGYGEGVDIWANTPKWYA